MENEVDSQDPLGWLSQILWPDGSVEIRAAVQDLSKSRARSAKDNEQPERLSWWASPSLENPNIIIPADNIAAAQTAVHRYHDGFTTAKRLRSLAAETTMASSRTANKVLKSKLLETKIVGESAGAGLLDEIAAILGVEKVWSAISLATPKSNRKPVIQLIDASGECLGWAKVAWNNITDALVATEARWLNQQTLAPLVAPKLIRDVELLGRRVVITSDVVGGRMPRRKSSSLPDLAAIRAIAAMGTLTNSKIADTAWWQSVESVLTYASDREEEIIRDTIDANRDKVFRVGAWHGDFAPWNIMTKGPKVQVIDWEFAADQAPLGFDLCHFHTQVGEGVKHLEATKALNYSSTQSPSGLIELGVNPDNVVAIQKMYWIELFRRTLALRAANYPTVNVFQGFAALERLERSREIEQTGRNLTRA